MHEPITGKQWLLSKKPIIRGTDYSPHHNWKGGQYSNSSELPPNNHRLPPDHQFYEDDFLLPRTIRVSSEWSQITSRQPELPPNHARKEISLRRGKTYLEVVQGWNAVHGLFWTREKSTEGGNRVIFEFDLDKKLNEIVTARRCENREGRE